MGGRGAAGEGGGWRRRRLAPLAWPLTAGGIRARARGACVRAQMAETEAEALAGIYQETINLAHATVQLMTGTGEAAARGERAAVFEQSARWVVRPRAQAGGPSFPRSPPPAEPPRA